MIINGQEVNKPCEDVLVIPRGTSEPIVLTGVAIKIYDEFHALCKPPEAPVDLTRNGPVANEKDATFITRTNAYLQQKLGWMVMETLKPSKIEWSEKINSEKCSTWTLWSDELAEAGFTGAEQERIVSFVLEVNSLSEAKLIAARSDFLLGRAQEQQAE
jgi:hypothetical protein